MTLPAVPLDKKKPRTPEQRIVLKIGITAATLAKPKVAAAVKALLKVL